MAKHLDKLSTKNFAEFKAEADHWLKESTAIIVGKGLCPSCWLRLVEACASEMANTHDGGRTDEQRIN